MPFPTDSYWAPVRSLLEQYADPQDIILAPNDFLELFPNTYPYPASPWLKAEQLSFAVFHKGMLSEVAPKLAIDVLQAFQPVFANEVFVVYAKQALPVSEPLPQIHLQPVVEKFGSSEAYQSIDRPSSALVVATQDCPWCLERSLPQLLKLNPLLASGASSCWIAGVKNG